MSRQKNRRVAPELALAILEGLRAADRPEEYLQDENPSITLPRRLGLSDVIGNEIRRYQEDVRKGRRVPEAQVEGLIGLVTRRDDAGLVFRRVGRALAQASRKNGTVRGMMPGSIRMALARRALVRRLRHYFGEAFAKFAKGGFDLTGRNVPFLDAESGGEACEIVSGLCEGVLEEYTGESGPLTYQVLDVGSRTVRWERALPVPTPAVMANETA